MTRLLRNELLKVATTPARWWFAIGIVVATALALVINCFVASDAFGAPKGEAVPVDVVRAQAAQIYTSGQYLGGLLLVLLGVLMVTNEFHHQTATTTFLTTPVRSAVVGGKLLAGALIAGLAWLITTAIDLGVGIVFLQSQQKSPELGTWSVQRAILFNLIVFILWVVLGLGIGALIRNQVAATITTALLYLLGASVVHGVLALIRHFVIKQDWVQSADVLAPSVAAVVFTSPVEAFEHSPPYWVGGLVLLGYGLVGAAIGTWIMRVRDIS
jgi:ABC-type transport system involved in multi-copper enzyme maturation permease subunit